MSPEISRLAGDIDLSVDLEEDASHGSLVKSKRDHDADDDEELEQLPACRDSEMYELAHTPCQDEADEFEERVMRAIEMNIRRTLSQDDIAEDAYDDQTVYV